MIDNIQLGTVQYKTINSDHSFTTISSDIALTNIMCVMQFHHNDVTVRQSHNTLACRNHDSVCLSMSPLFREGGLFMRCKSITVIWCCVFINQLPRVLTLKWKCLFPSHVDSVTGPLCRTQLSLLVHLKLDSRPSKIMAE